MKSVAGCVLFLAAAYGQVVPGRYVVELAGEPAAVAATRQGSRFAAREAGFAARRTAVRQAQMNARRAIANAGGTVLDSMDTVVNALIVSIPDAKAAQLARIPGVVKVHAVRRVQPLLDHALPLHKVPDAWNALAQGPGSAGAGIKIAMIDSGIDVHNPAFSQALPPLEGFPKALAPGDQQYTNAKIIVANNYTPMLPDGGDPDADDHDGHGTGTSMAAAGGTVVSPYGTLTGVAPQAYLGSYKVLDANGATSDVIAKAIDDAVADGMDVINISLGSYVASFSDIDPTNIDIAAIEAAAKSGVIVAVAAGNSGPGAGTIGDYASLPDVITAGAIMNDRQLASAITVPGVAPYEAFPGDGSNADSLAGPLFDVSQLDSTGQACSPLKAGSVTGMIVVILRGNCTFEAKATDVAAGGASGAIIYNNGTTNPFQMNGQTIGQATLPTIFLNQAEGQDLLAKLAASPGLQATLDFTGITPFPQRADLTDFSSRGPNIGSALKPDLAAVGEELVTAAQNTYLDGFSYSASGFIDTGGTSFSAPLTAGAAAVLKAGRPGLTMQQYRSLLINSAGPATLSADTPATVQQAGTGVMNLAAALAGTVTANPTALNFGTGAGTINQTLNLTLSNAGTVSDTYSISVVPAGSSPAPSVSASTLQLDGGASQSISVTVNVSDLAPGEYQGFLRVAGTNNPAVARIPYWFAVPGSDPVGISVLYQDDFDSPLSLSQQAVVFRLVDVAGLPYSGSLVPQVTVTGGTVRRMYPGGDIPGTYAVDLRTGSGSSVQLHFTVANAAQDVIIPLM